MTATVALVHGAWHGAWCWDLVLPLLAARGVPAVAIDLPGHGDSRDVLGDLHTDAQAVRALLDTIDGDIVLCGHSYGGAVISQAGAHPRVKHLVYVAAFPIDVDESCMNAADDDVEAESGASDLGSAIQFPDDGVIAIDPDAAAAVFYDDCAPDDVARAVARLGLQTRESLSQPATVAAWHEIPSTYAVCTRDRAVSPTLQRALARRTQAVVEWPTSHSPFLSRPDLVADLLIELATRA